MSAVLRIPRRVPQSSSECIGTVTGVRPGQTNLTWLPFCLAIR